jgi:site-specific DNA recombinase
MTVPLPAALYLRVSTARQAEHDVSIPDQRRQGEGYCTSRGYRLVETYVEPGASATNDRRPEFQRMIEAGISKPAPFDVVVVHSFSRFFRDHFELEFYVRKLARNGIKLVSITQEMGDDPMHVMMRQIMALFDEYQSKENAKHVLRALKENARQGFWNGSLPPIGYRVVAAEQRGAKVKKKLEIDPLHAIRCGSSIGWRWRVTAPAVPWESRTSSAILTLVGSSRATAVAGVSDRFTAS